MSNTSSVISVLATWLGTSGIAVTAFIKKAKADELRVESIIAHLEAEFNNVIAEIQNVESLVTPKPAPTPAPAVAKKAAPKKAAAPKKRLR